MHRLPSYTAAIASRLVSRLEAKHSTFLLSGTADSFSARFYPSEFHPYYHETRSLVTRNALVGSFFPPSWRPSPLHEIEWFAPAEEPSPLLDLPEINSYAKDEPARGLRSLPLPSVKFLGKLVQQLRSIKEFGKIVNDSCSFSPFPFFLFFLSLPLLPSWPFWSESNVNYECRKIENLIGLVEVRWNCTGWNSRGHRIL